MLLQVLSGGIKLTVSLDGIQLVCPGHGAECRLANHCLCMHAAEANASGAVTAPLKGIGVLIGSWCVLGVLKPAPARRDQLQLNTNHLELCCFQVLVQRLASTLTGSGTPSVSAHIVLDGKYAAKLGLQLQARTWSFIASHVHRLITNVVSCAQKESWLRTDQPTKALMGVRVGGDLSLTGKMFFWPLQCTAAQQYSSTRAALQRPHGHTPCIGQAVLQWTWTYFLQLILLAKLKRHQTGVLQDVALGLIRPHKLQGRGAR